MKVCATCGSEYPDDQSFCPADGSALKSTSAAADLVGAIVADRYRILEKLGEGGMDTVYLAEHVRVGGMSAIKVISQSLTQDADGADDHLVEMSVCLSGAPSQRLEAVRDTAILYYDWEGLADVDRAMAAYLTPQAFGALGDRRNALAWVQRALDLDPDKSVYRTYVTDLQGGQRP